MMISSNLSTRNDSILISFESKLFLFFRSEVKTGTMCTVHRGIKFDPVKYVKETVSRVEYSC